LFIFDNCERGSSLSLDSGSSFFGRSQLSLSGDRLPPLPPAPSPPVSHPSSGSLSLASRNARETLLDASRESIMNARVSTPDAQFSPTAEQLSEMEMTQVDDAAQDDALAHAQDKRASMQVPSSTARKLTISVTELNNGAGTDLLGGALIPPPAKVGGYFFFFFFFCCCCFLF
jgi:hypothetical protein